MRAKFSENEINVLHQSQASPTYPICPSAGAPSNEGTKLCANWQRVSSAIAPNAMQDCGGITAGDATGLIFIHMSRAQQEDTHFLGAN